MEYMEQQMQNYIESGVSEADRCYARIAELEELNQALVAQVAGIKDEISDFLAALDGMLMADLSSEEIADDLEKRLSNYDVPQQHLAEIRVQAIENFKAEVINELEETILVAYSGCRGTDASDLDDVKVIQTEKFEKFANQYAEKSGVVKSEK